MKASRHGRIWTLDAMSATLLRSKPFPLLSQPSGPHLVVISDGESGTMLEEIVGSDSHCLIANETMTWSLLGVCMEEYLKSPSLNKWRHLAISSDHSGQWLDQ